ncbi:hypothetical protein GQ44DRAFT_636325, partial [Phaeosphaeriaceae sp. PMI808]
PGTGDWLLGNERFSSWFNPYPRTAPLLWLSGIPGAGKTVLASFIIDVARSRFPNAEVAFFYCKYRDPQRNTFIAVARGILAQLTTQNKNLLPYIYEKASESGQKSLSTSALAKELLEAALRSYNTLGGYHTLYIIIDGLDECEREDRKEIVSWFRRVITPAEADDLRCLFISQDDGIARKDFSKLPSYKITDGDNRRDIVIFCELWAERIQQRFHLPSTPSPYIVDTIVQRAGGMFLFAELTAWNLYNQRDCKTLNEESSDSKHSRTDSVKRKGYARIIDRITKTTGKRGREKALSPLGWVICARRPLKWYEIQGAVCIELEQEEVHWGNQLIGNSKDLWCSLVEIRSDQTVVPVHQSVEEYLKTSGLLHLLSEECRLAFLCLSYLSFKGFNLTLPESEVQEKVWRGYYSFMDYAVANWASHTENVILQWEDIETTDQTQLVESIETFLDTHWTGPDRQVTVSKTAFERLQPLEHHSHFQKMAQAIVIAKRHASVYEKPSASHEVLDIVKVLLRIRSCFEHLTSSIPDDGTWARNEIQKFYGREVYKCPKITCVRWHFGFSSKDQRNDHIRKHKRSFVCTFEGCAMSILGCATEESLEKHLCEYHEEILEKKADVMVRLRTDGPTVLDQHELYNRQYFVIVWVFSFILFFPYLLLKLIGKFG